MLKMAVGQSDDVDPEAAIDDAVAQAKAQLGDATPKAAILFAAFDAFDPSLVERVRRAFPGIDVIGATSAAEMSSVAGYLEDSVALAVFASDNLELAAGMGVGIETDPATAAHDAIAQARARLTRDPRLCIVLTEGINAQRVIKALRDELPADVLIVGGAAGRHELGGNAPTYQFCNDKLSATGVVVLLMAGPVALSTAVGTGWRILGPRGTITAAGYGVIKEIDGQPAAQWASAYLDMSSATYGNPLAIQDAGTDDWYLRVALATDGQGGLRIPGEVPVGASVQLTTTSPDEMLRASEAAVERARAAFPEGASPQAALFFSCAVRKYLLGTRTGRELASARDLLPQSLPIAGMYCIGEIAPTGAATAGATDSHFLNETFVTLLMGS